MATTEEMVAGSGWVSDDSSFYGEFSYRLQRASRHSSPNWQSRAAIHHHLLGATIVLYHY
jgi:hypothetical protein